MLFINAHSIVPSPIYVASCELHVGDNMLMSTIGVSFISSQNHRNFEHNFIIVY